MSRPFNTSTPLGRKMVEQGWTRADLSAVAGIAERTLSEYLSGRKPIPTRTAWTLAELLRCDVRELVRGPQRQQIEVWRRATRRAS